MLINNLTPQDYQSLMSYRPKEAGTLDLEGKQVKKVSGCSAGFKAFVGKISVFANRVFQLFFGTHRWENDERLSSRLKNAVVKSPKMLDDKEKRAEIQNIFDGLAPRLGMKHKIVNELGEILLTRPSADVDPLKGAQSIAVQRPPLPPHLLNSATHAIDTLNAQSNASQVNHPDKLSAPVPSPNIVNSCYMNSALQALLASDGMATKMRAPLVAPLPPVQKPGESAYDFQVRYKTYTDQMDEFPQKQAVHAKLVAYMDARLKHLKQNPWPIMIAANELRQAIFASGLNDGLKTNINAQKDAADLMSVILGVIGYSVEVRDKIRGEHEGQTCEKWAHTSQHEPLLGIGMVNGESDLQKLVEQNFREQDLPGYEMKEGVKINAHKQAHLTSAPDVLVIQLKRFGSQPRLDQNENVCFDQKGNVIMDGFKNGSRVRVPPGGVIDLSCAMDPATSGTTSPKYRLKGYARHLGSLSCGHYVADVNYAGTWFHCNDGLDIDYGQMDHTDGYLFVFERIA